MTTTLMRRCCVCGEVMPCGDCCTFAPGTTVDCCRSDGLGSVQDRIEDFYFYAERVINGALFFGLVEQIGKSTFVRDPVTGACHMRVPVRWEWMQFGGTIDELNCSRASTFLTLIVTPTALAGGGFGEPAVVYWPLPDVDDVTADDCALEWDECDDSDNFHCKLNNREWYCFIGDQGFIADCAGLDFSGQVPGEFPNDFFPDCSSQFDACPYIANPEECPPWEVTYRFRYVQEAAPCAGGQNDCEFCP